MNNPEVSPQLTTNNVSVWYGYKQALFDVSLEILPKHVTGLIGPSGCGKSTLLRCFNRMNDFVDNCTIKGNIFIDGRDIYAPKIDPVSLRRKVGMVFQKPNPFPRSIYDNISYGLKLHKLANNQADIDIRVEEVLTQAGLWDEVKDRLDNPAVSLSGGQQQRLCIARTIAIKPDIILMDEPCSALDPIATARVEALIEDLKKDYTIIIVTHSMQQAARVCDLTAFFYQGKLIEYSYSRELFTAPKESLTEDYITGRSG